MMDCLLVGSGCEGRQREMCVLLMTATVKEKTNVSVNLCQIYLLYTILHLFVVHILREVGSLITILNKMQLTASAYLRNNF